MTLLQHLQLIILFIYFTQQNIKLRIGFVLSAIFIVEEYFRYPII